ncbi:MAG: pirin family protein [Deltaproteobacteria bacterium]
MSEPILDVHPLGFPWQTSDPFLFCVHHDDAYPAGNDRLGPDASLSGRSIGQDFGGKDGWSMYHGDVVPGFPQHPHRGFETITVVRSGLIDHSDSLGAAARFGAGDTQWLTAGAGIVHSEMFPLLERAKPNPLELFQIWLNLPAEDKMVEPHFAMLWSGEIPKCVFTDPAGRKTDVTVIAGALDGHRAPAPPPRSWASRPDTDVALWSIRMEPGAVWTIPAASNPKAGRTLCFFRGSTMRVAGQAVSAKMAVRVRSDVGLRIEAGDDECEILLMQARPIGEPVVQHGPFVMNSRAEIQRAMMDYQRTRFGGWPWPEDDPTHPRDAGRFARHVGGRIEIPDDHRQH